MESKAVLVTGATGYVGGRLVPRLLAGGFRVKAMGRSIEKMACRAWASHPAVELVQGDVLDPGSLNRALQGCWAAFYLVHAMIAKDKRFADADRASARNMARAARQAGLQRIIYLGGLGDAQHARLSPHLRSRHEVGEILKTGAVPVTIFQAAMILGSGSASFEILRYLVERLPVMITPRWVQTPSQPIAIANVLGYLVGCLGQPQTTGQTYDIGGPDILSYRDLIAIFAKEAGLARRLVLPVPVLTPRLSARWIHLVTPVPAAIAMPLTEGLSIPTVCRENRIHALIDQPLIDCRSAIRMALEGVLQQEVETCWSDAGALSPPEWADRHDAGWAGGTIFECGYRARMRAEAKALWQPISRIGGATGYYFGNSLWRLRGLLDRLAGGVGLSRGRRHPLELKVGDALDFWRVLTIEPPHRLTLLAEMKLPGQALLDIQVISLPHGRVELRLLSRFLPRGLGGILYWTILYPLHQWVFSGMLSAMARSIASPLEAKPERFTAKLPPICRLPAKPT
jgi:uncharacterized protein YbjT (DUF2867 family)